jgi:putative ABC transport system permease protein
VEAKTCFRLAWKDLGARGGNTAVQISILALSIAAYTGIRSSAGSFAEAVDQRQRIALGADLSIENWTNPTSDQWSALERFRASGGVWTLTTSTVFDAVSSSVPDPVPAVIKAVDPAAYPLYGEIALEPRQALRGALEGDAMIVSPELLRALHLSVGDTAGVNGLSCRISAVIAAEPDRSAGNLISPVRAIVSRDTLERSRLLRAGVPALQRILLRLPKGMPQSDVRAEMERVFTETGIFAPAESNPSVESILGTAGAFFDMVGWFAFVLGAAGAILTSHLFIESRLDILAVLKCLGAKPWQTTLWLFLELLLIGACGGFAGGVLGGAARYFLCRIAGIPCELWRGWDSIRLIAEGAVAGPLLALFSGIATVLAAGRPRPLELVRRNVRPIVSRGWLAADFFSWLVLGLASAAVAGVTSIAGILISALLLLLPVLYYSARAAISLLSRAAKMRMGSAWRLGLRNVCRGEAKSPVVVATLALIAALGVGAIVGERIVWEEMPGNGPLPAGNVLLLGLQDSDLDGVVAILNRHPGITRPYKILTLTWIRVAGGRDAPMMIAGCSSGQGGGIVMEAGLARRLGVHVGSELDLEQSERKIHLPVLGIRNLSPAERIWFSVSLPCQAIDGFGIFHHAALDVRPEEMEAVVADLRRLYPALDVETPAMLYERIHEGARNVMALARFLALATLAGGGLLAAALIGSTAAYRAKEIAILRMIGGRPRFMIRMLGWEFAALGGLAGLLGGALGILLIDALMSVLFYKALLSPHLSIVAVSMIGGAILGEMGGFIACARLLREPPLAALRAE